MIRMPSSLLVLALTACAPQADQGHTIYVAPAADGEWDDPSIIGSLRDVTGTIQEAIDLASYGDTVSVQSGTFTEHLVMKDGVKVIGAGAGQTLIHGTVTFDGLSTDTVLARVTVANPGTAYTGTGITVDDGGAKLEELEVRNWQYGVKVYEGQGVVLDRSTLLFNSYGFWADWSEHLTIHNNLFRSNAISGLTNYTSDGRVIFNTFVGNAYAASSQFEFGGALQFGTLDEVEVVANNIIVSNFFGINCQGCANTFTNNLVWGNNTNYANDASKMGDDLNVDPQFVNPPAFDYRLSGFSPAIDAANGAHGLATDFQGESRPSGSGYDIGMDEFVLSSYDLVVTEVMANATNEAVLEFVEVYNAGDAPVELAGLQLTDGDEQDHIVAFNGGVTVVQPGEYAVIVDPDYDGSYGIDPGVTVVTTNDTEVGNGLTTADPITLYEPDGTTVISTFGYPDDPGDGISLEMYALAQGDTSGNWRASECPSGSSPGAPACFPPTGDPAGLILTEVLANPANEATGEYVELFNPTGEVIDAAGLIIDDGDSRDTLQGFANSSTLIPPGQHALIVDPGYDYSYYLPNGITLLTTGDQSIGDGLATTDPVSLYKADGTTLIDAFTFPSNPGDSVSIEKVDYAAGDTAANWSKTSDHCTRAISPGLFNGAAGGICDQLLINEVMANPLVEDTGEFIEIFNSGQDPVDLAGLTFSDGIQTDTIASYEGGSTVLAPGQYALILDAEYADDYDLPAGALLVTTLDTHLGNGLGVADDVVLRFGDHLLDSYHFPFNPGNGVSAERIWARATDAAENWVASTCPTGSSPGAANCAVGGSFGGSGSSAYELVISEVMANAVDEDTGEYVEIYNYGSDPVDLRFFVLWDGDALDTLHGYWFLDDTILLPGQYAVILDNEYAFEYTLPVDALWLTTGDTTIGSGLSTDDEVFLFEPDGITLIDSFTSPSNPGNGVSIEKIDLLGGDIQSNWRASLCVAGHSPGAENCD